MYHLFAEECKTKELLHSNQKLNKQYLTTYFVGTACQ